MLCPEKSQLQRLRHSLHSTEEPLTQWTYWCAVWVWAKWKQNNEDGLAANHLTRSSPFAGQGYIFLQGKQTPVEAADLEPSCHKNTIPRVQKDEDLNATGPGMRQPCHRIFCRIVTVKREKMLKAAREKTYKGTPTGLIFQHKFSVGVPWYISSAKKKNYNQEFSIWQAYHWDLKTEFPRTTKTFLKESLSPLNQPHKKC